MAAESVSHYKEFLIILGVAGLVVPLFLRVGVSAILAFLLIGILLSPDILGRVVPDVPFLSALVITESENLSAVAELGVVFLLFLIGLELSFERLNTMRRLVFGLGGLQVVISLLVIAGTAVLLLGLDPRAALIAGAALSLSSTAIVVQILSDAKRLGSQTGRTSFAILLFQDLAVIPLLLLVSILGQQTDANIALSIGKALLQAVFAIAMIIGVGRYLLRPVLRLVAGTNSADLFMAATLLIAVGTGVAANMAGLSMALGAFIAGLMLAETEYRRAIEAIIEPFKGLLLGTFFLVVGLRLDLDELLNGPAFIISVALGLILIKAIVILLLARLFRVSRGAAIETALLLGPCGEFGFVIVGTALGLGVIDDPTSRSVLLVVTLTMIAIPLIARFGAGITMNMRHKAATAALNTPLPNDNQARVIIAGFGRVGHLVAAMLDEHKIPYIAVDNDAALVARERGTNQPVYYGDAANPEFLKRCGLAEARALAVTMDNQVRVDDVTKVARKLRDDLKIIARARDERHAQKLYALGVTEAVPETIESSLQLGEALLVETGVPMGLAIASVHERRDGFRKLLGRPNRKEQLDLARKRLRREKTIS